MWYFFQNGKQVSSRPVVGKSSQPLVGKVDRHYGVIASKTQIQDDPLDVLAAKVSDWKMHILVEHVYQLL